MIQIKKIHFIGIGGIGMSGLAEILMSQGFNVSGSDLATSEITDHLKELGAEIHKGHSAENISIVENIVPYRKEGSYTCLAHVDEGYVNGNWVKGETTARNEKRLVMEMQQQKINYKEDGIKNILDCLSVDSFDNETYSKTTILNVVMK